MRRLRAHRTAGQSASTRNKPWADPSPSAVCPRSLRSWERKGAVRQASRFGPDTVLWPIGFLVNRRRRRLAETHGAVLEAVAADSLGRQVAHRRRAGVFGAANLGRTWATAGVDVEDAESWIKVEFGDADEPAAQGSSVVQRRLRRRGTLETAMIPAESSLALAGGAPPSSAATPRVPYPPHRVHLWGVPSVAMLATRTNWRRPELPGVSVTRKAPNGGIASSQPSSAPR